MAVVLVHPPAVAEADAEIAEQDAEDIVGPPGAKDLAVPGVVAEEADLGEYHGLEYRHGQQPPRIAHQNERDPAGPQQAGGEPDLPDVVAGAAFQQSRLLDLPGQLCVFAAAPGSGLGAVRPWRPGCGRRWHEAGVLPRDGRIGLRGSHRRTPRLHIVAEGDVPPGSGAGRCCAASQVLAVPPSKGDVTNHDVTWPGDLRRPLPGARGDILGGAARPSPGGPAEDIAACSGQGSPEVARPGNVVVSYVPF